MLHPGPLIAAEPILVTTETGAPALLDGLAESLDPACSHLRSTWFAAAADGATIKCLVGRRGPEGDPIAAIPLVERRLGPLSLGQVPGSYWPGRSVPIASDASDDELVLLLSSREARRTLGRAWRLGPVLADDPCVARLEAAAARSGWSMISRRVATCFIIDLKRRAAEAGWPSSKRRQTLRRRQRRLAEHGELVFSKFTGPEWNGDVLDRMAAVERESWVAAEAGLKDLKFLPEAPARAIWEKLFADPALAERFTGWLLSVGDEPAAFVFALDSGPRRHVIANGFSERFREGSPGMLLLFHAFLESIAAGFETIGWGAGDAGYKTEVGGEPGPEMRDLLFVRGALAAAIARRLWRSS